MAAFSSLVARSKDGIQFPEVANRVEAGPVGVLLMSLWFGLIAGMLELGALAAQDVISGEVTVQSIRTNRHYAWMIPASDASIFTAVGLPLALVAWRWPGFAARWMPALLAFPAGVAPLLAVRGFYPIAAVGLAMGIASLVARSSRLRGARTHRLMKASLPILIGVVALLAAFKGGRPLPDRDTSVARAPDNSPNVLLIVMDTVRADHLSLYGYDRETTPNLKRWAGRGIRFDKARSTAPWTLPSHASMFTGLWAHQLSVGVSSPLDDTEPTLAEYLGDRGYSTAGFVANTYYCNAWYGIDRGFDRYEDFYENDVVSPVEILQSSTLGRRIAKKAGIKLATPGSKNSRKSAAQINRDALAWIAERPGRPFFAFLNYYDAHGPYEPPDNYRRRFTKTVDSEIRQASFATAPDAPTKQPVHDRPLAKEEELKHEGYEPGAMDVDSYDECIAYLDGQIGRLLDDLDRQGILDNTLVIVTSDHGEHFGERGLRGHGHSLYRPLIDVPLLIIPPSHGPRGLRVGDLVSLRDIPATVVDLLGVGDRSSFPGQTLARCWATGHDPDRALVDPPLSEVEHQKKFSPSPLIPASLGPLWSLANEGMTYIRESDGDELLYDIEKDPLEVKNLAESADFRPILERFRKTLKRLLRDDPPEIGPIDLGPMILPGPSARVGDLQRGSGPAFDKRPGTDQGKLQSEGSVASLRAACASGLSDPLKMTSGEQAVTPAPPMD
jgi:arylsulfatase A-like enzyme